MDYDLGHTPTKSQIFAQKICYIAVNDWGFPIETLSLSALAHLADEALQRFPEECDARFRQMAIGRVRVFQRRCEGIDRGGRFECSSRSQCRYNLVPLIRGSDRRSERRDLLRGLNASVFLTFRINPYEH